ncbi:MAG TPA: hypothetical protein VGO29_08975 [Solirubrobacteraceae bacterium]|nr:hypothetical protein [Solirubrobacteraceae bacterium]
MAHLLGTGDLAYARRCHQSVRRAGRVTYCRRALLFAAFAAEAYANDFLYEKWAGQDRDALERLSAVDKYALLPALAETTVLDRGGEPLQRVKWLFDRRNELVHPKPRLGDRDLTWDPTNHNPIDAAESIVAVAEAVAKLTGEVPDASILSYVLAERQALLEYGGRAAGEPPEIHDPPSLVDLLSDARRQGRSRRG